MFIDNTNLYFIAHIIGVLLIMGFIVLVLKPKEPDDE